ncbi:RcnB family protein [Hydrogenophaga sp.]|uniref:RcnB family protein n=1 Tax=Hydrogenophaga sp. TaxID=1904254 RepID=UPI00272924B7|nr:RcnB family protein [Hydrogenophaga sp.]MDO9437570.1 RcnB family protein [Hydrogenophaga sp.]
MKTRNLVVYVLAAASLGVSSMSFAQGARFEPSHMQRVDDRRDDRRDFRNDRRDDRRDDRHDRRDDRRDFRHDRRDFRPGPVVNNNHYYYNARGPEFRRGGYIPREYRNRQYVVVNPQQYRLAPPPRGHQWVQVGSDYVLVAIATGLIANLIFNN